MYRLTEATKLFVKSVFQVVEFDVTTPGTAADALPRQRIRLDYILRAADRISDER